MSLPGFEWLKALCEDADPVRSGFQASWLYVAWNVLFPAVLGVAVALLVGLLKRAASRSLKKESD